MNQHLIKISLIALLVCGVETSIFAQGSCCGATAQCGASEAPRKSSAQAGSCCASMPIRGACCAPKAAKVACSPKSSKPAGAQVRGCGCGKPKPKPGTGVNGCPECQNCGEVIHNRGCGCGKPKPKPKPRPKP